MSDDVDLMDIVEDYVNRFGDGPPIFDMDDDEAIAAMKRAIESGVPMEEPEA